MKKNIFIASSLFILFFVVFFGCEKKDEVDTSSVESIEYAVQKEEIQKNISGISSQAFSDVDIAHTSTIEERDFEGSQKKWIIISLADAQKWHDVDDQKKKQIIQGLINTSRLQINRDFGGVQIISNDDVIMHGWWDAANGYVIM